MAGPLQAAFLTHTPPLPAVSGERIRSWNLLAQLAGRGWGVSLFSLVHEEGALTARDEEQLTATCEDVVLAPFTVGPARRRGTLVADMLLRRAFQERYFLSTDAVENCHRWISRGEFDVVVIGQLYMFGYVPTSHLARAVLDTHNSELWRVETMARTLGWSARGLAARAQRRPVARFEQRVAAQVARVTAVSDDERAYFERLAPGRVDLVPNGVDCKALRAREGVPPERCVLFLGSLDYSANVDGVSHLVEHVLPLLADSGISVDIVGSNPRPAVFDAARRSPVPMRVAGYVVDTSPYWERARALVVPLRVGGGTRLKILEALARGVPVVSTSLGCEGLGLKNGEHLLVADEAGDFAACVLRLLEDDELCRSLATQGRALVEARYDWRMIGDSFERSVGSVAAHR